MPIEVTVALIILLLAASLFLFTYYLKKKHYSKIDALDGRKKELESTIPIEKAKTLEKMMITGQSKEMADSVLQAIEKIEVKILPNIESHLFEAEQSTDRYKFKQASSHQQEADEELKQLKEKTEELVQSIDELLQREQANLKNIDTIKKRYHRIRKELLAKSFSFGEAINNLEEKLGQMEKMFTSFSDLTASGDHEEAKKVINQLENRLIEMEELMKEIPPILKTINTVYKLEVKEIEEGYQQLLEQKFIFPDELIIEEEIQQLQEKITKMNQYISELNIKEVKEYQEKTEVAVDRLYDAMELEIEAKASSQKLLKKLNKIIHFVSKQEREFSLEKDRISQSYVLYKDEENLSDQLKETLEEQKTLLVRIQEEMEDNSIPYSESKALLETSFNQLEELSSSYDSLSEVLYSYRKQELIIKKDMEDMAQDIKEMKRYVESKHLPGLSKDYLDLFFYTTDHIEELAKELARPKLDLEAVIKLHDMCEEDCDHLAEETEDLVDNALLTELTSQRLYRHREGNPAVIETIKYSENLFLDEYDYETSLKMVREKLESIEPGAFEEVKTRYNKEKTYT